MSEQITSNPSVPSQVVQEVKFPQFVNNLGIIPTSYKDSMSYYENLAWLCKYLEETVIPTVNENGDAVEELQGLYIELNSYVTHYFDTLDVQEEINNKLDQMAQDGTLNRLVANYIDEVNQLIETQNNSLRELNAKITSATNGSPLVASSTSGMTDTTKIYVNTTDGKWYYYNGENWTIGGTYQTAENSETVDYLNDRFTLYWKGINPLVNYLNPSSYQSGKLYSKSNNHVVISSYAGYGLFDPFPVTANKIYAMYNASGTEVGQRASAFCYVANKDGTVIYQENVSGANIHRIAPTEDGYLFLTVIENTSYPADSYPTFMLTEFEKNPSEYKNFNVPYDYEILEESFETLINYYETASQAEVVRYNTINVGVNELYTTITDAVNSINDSSATNRYNIIIEDGTYYENDITLPNYVNLYSESNIPENCIIDGTQEETVTDSQISQTSTINMNYNNELKGLTIIAKNERYPIHDETGGSFQNWTQTIENCIIEHKGNQEVIDYRIANNLDYSSVWASCHGLGIGASSGAVLNIDNTKIISVEVPFYAHGASSFVKPYIFTIKNSQLISTNVDSSIFIDNTTPTINGNTLNVINTFLNARYAIVANTYKYNAYIDGKNVPIYQRPNNVGRVSDFPIFTAHTKMLKAGESLSNLTFVKSTDGMTITHADSTTPLKDIIGYVVGNHSSGDLCIVQNGYIQPTSQTWPETPQTSGTNLKLNNNGQLINSSSDDDIVVGITEDRWNRLYI